MSTAVITQTDFSFPSLKARYQGKVRDVYYFEHQLVVVSTDRLSAFDVVLPRAIPYKGQVLNLLSYYFMQQTPEVPHWITAVPHANVAVGRRCEALPVEMIIRGYLAGSAWRAYAQGQRVFNGNKLPEGLRENDALPEPILTPSTKAAQGNHDEDISTEELLSRGLLTPEQYEIIAQYTRQLFARGTTIAAEKGLILADTKYEFGIFDGKIYLIDEIHTPDSSRYFDADGFAQRQERGEAQPQRSKEMVRKWLMSQGFQGLAGQQIPEMTEEWALQISQAYIQLYEQLTGQAFVPQTANTDAIAQQINTYLNS
ncbi:phosphoribosylaminoimidazolesuccinocarboxamide synthase [Eisenibacter elegans]|jgi:phosphoribosylaminoimidazole-succinocarboxamide synthase|uniref:phosphoribosylaminoimidazolesuccinocarboxamide synthase n=1 Tax=Eisenibacter elegans TaxID=997 RepID=UPI00040E4528|nr:phosphoribosylaminoimidazolesuccinocarboxamide synthase [Eisenibacter elegans]